MPNAVGKDDAIRLFNGPATAPNPNDIAPGLSPAVCNPIIAPICGAAYPLSAIHWYHLDIHSNKIDDGGFSVSANDVVEMTSDAMLNGSGIKNLDDQPGYLVLVNESARQGGEPLFSFSAEAFIVDGGRGNNFNFAYNIPVYPLDDEADTASPNGLYVPSLHNNVVEAEQGGVAGSPYGDSVKVSPIISGIRTGAVDGPQVRVVDMPIYAIDKGIEGFDVGATYIVWNDRNATYEGVDESGAQLTYGLTGKSNLYNTDEEWGSTENISLDHQLNMIDIGYGRSVGPLESWDIPHKHYFINGAVSNPGFVRWYIQQPKNLGELDAGAYSAAVIFRLPNNAGMPIQPVAGRAVEPFTVPVNDAYSQFPIDLGFFGTQSPN